jgi:hypothetical protein
MKNNIDFLVQKDSLIKVKKVWNRPILSKLDISMTYGKGSPGDDHASDRCSSVSPPVCGS